MRLLITGGAGFIGSNLIHLLNRERPGWEVWNLDRLTYAANPQTVARLARLPRHRLICGDVADPVCVAACMEVDAVVNLAAESHVDRSLEDAARFLQTNVLGTQVLLQEATRRRIPRFLQVSTDEVYGEVLAGRSSEDSPPAPSNPYAASKAGADLLVQAWHRSYGLPALITRCANNYGPYQHPEKLIPRMILRALRGEALPIFGDGAQVRDWIHVEDHCRGLLAALEHGAPGRTYNLGAEEERTNLTVARAILGHAGGHAGEPGARIAHVADRPGHDRRYAVDAGRARRELGWAPRHRFDAGLAETVAWYAAERAWWEGLEPT